MTRRSRFLASLALLVILALLGAGLVSCGGDKTDGVRYHCPMHPTYVTDHPGECPICHMDLVPMEETALTHAGHDTSRVAPPGYSVVQVGDDALRLAGIRTAPAVLDTLSRHVRAVGIVKADETRLYQVSSRVSGWVKTLAVTFTGQFVRRGDPLFAVYSPELLASQVEYLNALKAVRRLKVSRLPEVREGADDLLHATRSRLSLFEVPDGVLRRIEKTGEPEEQVMFEAPATGYVTAKDVLAGARIEPGMALFTIADLSHVWLDADVYEYEAPLLAVGTEAAITLSYQPGLRRTGRVAYVYPTLDPVSRTLKVRFDLPNPDLTLRPDMYADVEFQTRGRPGVVIPDDAILDSGARQIVFVETTPGTFVPREVTVGTRVEGRALILSGVTAGEQVVTRANFLLDSESRLRAAVRGMTGEPAHGSHP